MPEHGRFSVSVPESVNMTKRRKRMTELKPVEQYEITAIPPKGALPSDSDNGKHSVPDGLATIDESSRRAAMARAIVENEKKAREQQCGAEIDAAITAILKKFKCAAKFCELREGGQTVRIWLQPVAVDEASQ